MAEYKIRKLFHNANKKINPFGIWKVSYPVATPEGPITQTYIIYGSAEDALGFVPYEL